jgi:hypothetical protein
MFDFNGFSHRFMAGFGYAIGIAAAKWLCGMLPIHGFNLNF